MSLKCPYSATLEPLNDMLFLKFATLGCQKYFKQHISIQSSNSSFAFILADLLNLVQNGDANGRKKHIIPE